MNGRRLGGAGFLRSTVSPKLVEVERVYGSAGRRPRLRVVGARCAATQVSMKATCPRSCPLYGAGCYAAYGFLAKAAGAFNDGAASLTAHQVIQQEVGLLASMFPRGVPQDGPAGAGRALRLHVSGDTCCARHTRLIAHAIANLKERGLGPAWCYSHRWRSVPRGAWGDNIEILASVESEEQVREAHGRGYRSALVVSRFEQQTRYRLKGAGAGWFGIPCPYQTQRVPCMKCGLCFRPSRSKTTILFEAHGSGRPKAIRAIKRAQRLPIVVS